MPESPFILASNHESPCDSLLLMMAFKKPIRFLAAGHLFKPWWKPSTWWFWLTLKILGRAIPTGNDAINKSMEALRKGQALGIFPQGDVHPAFTQGGIHTGAIVISQLSQTPILPVRIIDSAKFWAFPAWKIRPWNFDKIQVKIGKPFLPAQIDLNNKPALQLVADDLMKRIFAL